MRTTLAALVVAGLGALLLPWQHLTSTSGVGFSGRTGAWWEWNVHGPGWGLRLTAALVFGLGTFAVLRLGRTPGVLAALVTIASGYGIVQHHRDFVLTFVSLSATPEHLKLHSGPGTWCAAVAAALVLTLALRPRPADPAPGDPGGHP